MKLFTYFLFTFVSLQISYAQTHIYKHFGVDEGLPSSEVYDIYQDKLGYVWFATDKGLSRYNGYEFENFTTKDGLPDNTILDFYPQDNGQIWCYGYHSQSLFYFDEVFNGFKPYKHNDKLKQQLIPKSVVKSVVLDENNTLHIGGFTIFGLIKITEEGLVTNHFDLKNATRSADINLGINTKKGIIFSIYHDYQSEGNTIVINSNYGPSSRVDIAFLNNKKSILIDKKLGVVSKNGAVKYYNTKHNPIGIKRINNNSFFVGYYSNGAEIRDVSGEVIETFLPKKSITSFLIDTEGSYWFSTLDDGVYYIKNPNVSVFTKEHISSLVKNQDNTLFLGYNNGDIGQIVNGKVDILHKGFNSGAAFVEFDNVNNELYGYDLGQLINFTKQTKIAPFTANKLPEHIEDELIGTATHYLLERKKDTFHGTRLDHKIQDACLFNTTVYIATASGLLIKKDSVIKPDQSLDILKSRIDDIDFNKNSKTLYMATQGAGVIVKNDSIYNITKLNGLTNPIVSEVHIENDSTLWACTNTGLNRIVFKANNNYNITTITKADGLISNDIDDVEIINDTIWVATKKGLCYFSKNVLAEKEASKILSLSLVEVRVNNKKINSENIKLKYNQNNIDFKLQAISHKKANTIKYFYRIKNLDTTWSETTSRSISFPSLAPGNYTFEAKASVLNNRNDLFVLYNFKIKPPFWKSWWFYSSCFLLLTALIYLFFRVRVLSYNEDVFRELIRLAIKRLKRKEQFYTFRSNGEDFKIPTRDILFINSQGNYLDIITKKKTYTIRCKIGDFVSSTPDTFEYLRIHRSYIIRIDQVSSKGKNWVVIKDNKIPVGETYLSELDKIHF